MNTAKVMKERNGGNIPGVHSQILKEQPPLKTYLQPKGRTTSNLPFPSIFRGELLEFGCVYVRINVKLNFWRA